MRLLFGLVIISTLLFSCNSGDKTPDVSNIKVELTTQRFEQDLFTMDTVNFSQELDKLQLKYPSFTNTFIYDILSTDPRWPNDTIINYVRHFATDKLYKSIYDSSQLLFKDFAPYEKEIKNALQFCKYYFPAYKYPQKIITYIGPVDGTGTGTSDEAIVVGLQHYLGKNYSLYKTSLVQDTYPQYLTENFEAPYIVINVMKKIISQDLYPEKLEDKSLVQQMVEKGKRLYVLSKLLPRKEEYQLIGYTAQQLKDCYTNEQKVWDLFVQNNLLQTTDDNIIKNYIGESPKTQELGDESPGNIGAFAGWQIVKKYMNKNEGVSLQKLMTTDNDTILQEAKYKP
ncbi:MAG: hypothetical protein WDM90_13145 [Ferruginibacter sp.]